MSDQSKEGEYEMEKIELDERQAEERGKAEKFIKLHRLAAEEAREHREALERDHDKEREELKQRHGK